MPSYPRNAYDVDDIEEAELRRLERGRSPESLVVDLDDDALTKNGGHASVAAFAPQASIAAVADGPTSLASALDAALFAPAGSALAKTVPGATTSDQVVFSADEAYAEGASPSPQAIIESSYTSAELPGTPNQRDRNVTGTRSGPGRSERSGTD